jgi:hypothetical protein
MTTNKHANLRLTAKLLPIIAPFIAKADIRYYLNAINVRPYAGGGAIICATNGHALGAIHDPDAVCEHEVILRFDSRMQQASAAGLNNSPRQIVMIGDRLAVVDHGGADVYIQAGRPDIEATYPRYERVIPKLEDLQPGLPGTFGAPVIALAQKAAIAAGKVLLRGSRASVGMAFFSKKDNPGCAVFRLGCAPSFVGVMMSMRGENNLPAAPAWVAALPGVDDLASITATSAQSVCEEVPA